MTGGEKTSYLERVARSRKGEKLGGVLAISMNYVWGLVKVYQRMYTRYFVEIYRIPLYGF